jgi:hypothetical protein
MTLDTKRMSQELGNKYTKTLRVHKRVYHELNRLKAVYEEMLNQELARKAEEAYALQTKKAGQKQKKLTIPVKHVSFTDLLMECCRLGDLMIAGQKFYAVGGKLVTDLETAYGEAVMQSVAKHKEAEAPIVLLKLGEAKLPS